MEHVINTTSFQNLERVKKLSKSHSEKLNEYVDQLLWWNKRVNLVSRDVSRETLMHHVEHSITLSTSHLVKEASRLIDAGSGGGLPGIPLGIIYPGKEVILNDIVSKKMIACKQVIMKLGLDNVQVEKGSIAKVKRQRSDVIVSKHAFKINDLVDLLKEEKWKGIVLLKGVENIQAELEGVETALRIDIQTLETFDNSFYAGKAIVEITDREDE